MSNNNNTQIKIGSDYIKKFGRSLYTSHPLIIVTRELMQNSIDAVRSKYKSQSSQQIDITIKLQGNDQIELTCSDNGIGMNEDVLLNKFLTLGESGKRDSSGNTGGFGIAKAAVMSCDYWEVTTLDNYIDVNRLGMPLLKVNPIKGTTVKVLINEGYYHSTIEKTLGMIYLSNVKVNLKLYEDDNLIIDDNRAGLNRKFRETKKGDNWQISLVNHWKDYYEISGCHAFRLNGLVQFVDYGNSHKPNAIIDIETNALPHESEYPFPMSM